MHDLKLPQESFYLNPEIFHSSSGTDLELAFERAALDKRLLWRGGHWLWGVRTFEHDPSLPYPHVLPVIAGKTWRVDVDAKSNPLSIDPPIAGRWRSSVESILRRIHPPAVTEDGCARPEALILECLEDLRPDAVQRQAKFEKDLESRRRALDHWASPWKGRDPVFECFDDPGYDLLVRVSGIFGKLSRGVITRAQAVGHVEPKAHDRQVVEIDSDWFDDHVRLDFYEGRLEVAVAGGERHWQLMFSDVMLLNAAYGGSPALTPGVAEPQVDLSDLPTRMEALNLVDKALQGAREVEARTPFAEDQRSTDDIPEEMADRVYQALHWARQEHPQEYHRYCNAHPTSKRPPRGATGNLVKKLLTHRFLTGVNADTVRAHMRMQVGALEKKMKEPDASRS